MESCMTVRTFCLWSILAFGLLLCSMDSPAQTVRGPLDIVADSTEYLSAQKTMVGRGNVTVRDGDDSLSADYISVQTETLDVHAVGNVVFRRGGQIWQGDEFRYNMRTRQGDFGRFKAFYDPFYITAEESRRPTPNSIILNNATITTCDGDDPAVSIEAKEASIIDNRLRAKGVVFYAGGFFPYFYLPYYTRSLDSHERFFQFVPGYSSRMGPFLLTAYNYYLNEDHTLRGVTHFDMRAKRGLGLGQDFVWGDREKTYDGIVQGYYLSDSDPKRGPDTERRTDDLIDKERYRLRLAHNQRFDDRTYMIGELNYLSDPFILQDFFGREFRNQVQPENRITLTHREDHYTASVQLNKRLNDFYDNVDRLPEFSLIVPRLQIADSDFYYESRNTATYLERVFADGSDQEDYDAIRVDSSHLVFYPTRHFGFLNVIPRAGYRGTYYSKTYDNRAVTNSFIVTDDEGNVTVTNQVDTIVRERGSDIRNVMQLGWESSFKAFQTWNDLVVLGDGDGLRHVVEPYLNHTYQARPNLRPDELPQFDAVDTLDKRHDLQLGVRNKIQTRRQKNIVDILDLNVFTFYRLEKEQDQEDFSDLFWDARINLTRWLPIELDGSYDMYESEMKTFNAEVAYLMTDASRVGLDYRYRRDSQSLLGVRAELFPRDRWSFEVGARMDFEDDDLEEHYYFVRHTGRCVGWGLGYRQVDDDKQVWLQLWLTAFPNAMIDVGY